MAIPESDWPAIEAPADVPRVEGETPATAVVATPPAATPASAVPPVAAAPQTPPAAPVASPEPPITTPNLSDEVRQQLQESASINRQLLQQNTVLMQELQQLRQQVNAPPPAPAPVPEVVDERTQAIRDRLYEAIPFLKDLEEIAKRKGDLLGAAAAVPQFQQDRDSAIAAENRFWESHRDRSFATVHNSLAAEILGAGKTAADLNEIVKSGLNESFRGWVSRDPSRAARYEAQDGNLIGEFVAEYKAHAIAPLRRTENVSALTAAETTPAVPRGGPAVPPGPATPQTPQNEDEDAIHSRAWDKFRQTLAS